jgi:GNAT superfamily N-acetyltransferase
VASIRGATLADAQRMSELSGVLGYPVASDTIAGRLDRLLGSATDIVLVAVVSSGSVVGWIHGSEYELLETGRHCEILGLVVDAAHRKAGAGRQLVSAVEAWAAGRGLESVAVRSNIVRTESHPFYERLGYQRVKTQHAYFKQLQI